MAEIIINYKGGKGIVITNNYYPSEGFIQNKSTVNFNAPSSDFRNELLTSPCGDISIDKIKIISTPDKGRLFYVTNPGVLPNAYANVYVGQIISVSDLLNNNIMRFNAEGSVNDEEITTYITSFKFERYCALNSTNVITTVELNMISAEREFEIITPEDLDFFVKSAGTIDRVNPAFDYCAILNLASSCYVYRQLRSGFDIQTGDRVFTNFDATTSFNGGLKYYKLLSSLLPADSISYIAKIDNNGIVTSVFGTCD